MSNNQIVSAAAASRDRTGVNHIGRLVELWLSRYEKIDQLNNPTAGQSRNRRPRSTNKQRPSRQPHVSTRPQTVSQLAIPQAPMRTSPIPMVGAPSSETQNTFGFYQMAE